MFKDLPNWLGYDGIIYIEIVAIIPIIVVIYGLYDGLYIYISGWWYTYPSEKYESQMGLLFPTEWKNKKCSQTTNLYIFIYQ